MSHMVIYRGSDGKPGYHQTDDIHDAVGFVEQMRNEQGVEHARIFRLEEVVFQYKSYFRVELAEAAPAATELEGSVDLNVVGAEGSSGADAVATSSTNANGHGQSGDNGSSGDSASGSGEGETASSDDDTAGAGSRKGLFGR